MRAGAVRTLPRAGRPERTEVAQRHHVDGVRAAAFDPRDALTAADPDTPADTLRYLADHDASLHPFIVTNPSAPKDLCDEIKALGDPKVTSLFDKWDDVTDGKFSSRGQDAPA